MLADWMVKKLEEIAKTFSGGTPSRQNLSFYSGNIKWFTTGELRDNMLYDSKEHISSEAIKFSSAKIFPSGNAIDGYVWCNDWEVGYHSK